MRVSSTNAPAEWLARRERAVVLLGLGLTIALAWAWILAGGGMNTAFPGHGAPADPMNMSGMPGMSGASTATGVDLWSGTSLVVFAMWAVMMVAMMLPGAAPAVLLLSALSRSQAPTMRLPSVGTFALGYLLVWTGFAAVATAAHVMLQQAALLSPAMRATSSVLAALLLMAAGAYQFTPLKTACLRHCRSPIQFFTRHWRPGVTGALRLGVLHGGYCVGCCWVLMALLFVGGVMNPWWIAALAAFILIEKAAFLGAPLGRMASGAGLALAGAIALVVM